MMFFGLYEHIGELIEGYPYEVLLVDRWDDDIFVVYHKILIDVFRVLQIPRCHETFTSFFELLKANNIQNCYLECVGRADDGNPCSRYMAVGLPCM